LEAEIGERQLPTNRGFDIQGGKGVNAIKKLRETFPSMEESAHRRRAGKLTLPAYMPRTGIISKSKGRRGGGNRIGGGAVRVCIQKATLKVETLA